MAGPNFDGLDTTTADIWPRRVYHLREEVICWVFWAGKFPEPPRGDVCLTEAGSFTGCRLQQFQRGRLNGPSRLSKFSKRFVVYLSLHSGVSTFGFEASKRPLFKALCYCIFVLFFSSS